MSETQPPVTAVHDAENPESEAPRRASSALNLGPLPRYPGYVLRRAQSQSAEELLKILAPFGLRRSSFATLLLLKHNPGATPSDLADTLGVARTNFVPLLEGLRKQGLVVRQSRPDDRRFRALYLTREGVKLLGKVEPLIEAFETQNAQEIERIAPGAMSGLYHWLTQRP